MRKIVRSTVLTDSTLEPVSKRWRWQLRHQIWRELPYGGIDSTQLLPHSIAKYRQRILTLTEAGDGEYPKSILADRVSHIIPPTRHIASRHQIHQDATDSGGNTPSPIQNTGLWLHLEKAIKAWVRKRTDLRSGEMHWNDTLPYHWAVNSDTTKHMLWESITSPQWLHMQGGAEGWSSFEGVIYKTFTIWLSKHIPKQYNTVIPFHFVSVYYNSSR